MVSISRANTASPITMFRATAYLAAVLLMTLLSGCMEQPRKFFSKNFIAKDDSISLANSDVVGIKITGAPVHLKANLSRGKIKGGGVASGAAGGAAGAAIGVVELAMVDPAAIVMVPVVIPVGIIGGAIISAARAPSEEQWKSMEEEYPRIRSAAGLVASVMASKDLPKYMEKEFHQAIGGKLSSRGVCVHLSRARNTCGMEKSVASVAIQVDRTVEARLVRSPGGRFSDKPVRDSYVLLTDLFIRLTLPGISNDSCYRLRYSKEIFQEDVLSKDTEEFLRLLLDDQYAAIAWELAYNLYDWPLEEVSKRTDSPSGKIRSWPTYYDTGDRNYRKLQKCPEL